MKNNQKKIVGLLLVIAMLGVTLLGEVGVAAAPKTLRVSVQAWILGKYKMDEAAKNFEKKHGVKVIYNKVDNFDTTTYILEWSQGKTSNDLVIGGSREQAVAYAARNYIVNFDKGFFDSKLKKSDFIPAFLELGNIEKTQYMIPFCCEVMYIVVNKDLMKKAGLTDANGNVKAPDTWEELYEMAKKATIIENGKVTQTGLSIDWGTNFMTYSYLACLQGLKGSIYESNQKTIDFTSKQAKELLTTWKQLVDNKISPVDTFADMDAGRSNFKAGKVAMLLSAASRWVESESILGDSKVSVIPIPGTGKTGTLVYIHGICIPKVSKNQALAKQFIKEELLSRDLQVTAMDKYGKMSPLEAHYSVAKSSEWKGVLDILKKSVTCPLYKDWNKLDQTVQVEIQKYLTDKQSVDDTLGNLAKTLKSLDQTTGMQ